MKYWLVTIFIRLLSLFTPTTWSGPLVDWTRPTDLKSGRKNKNRTARHQTGCAILCRDAGTADTGTMALALMLQHAIIGCVNAKRPLNIEQASVKRSHLLSELASLNVSSTRRATDAPPRDLRQ